MNAVNRTATSIFDVFLTPFEVLGAELSLVLVSGVSQPVFDATGIEAYDTITGTWVDGMEAQFPKKVTNGANLDVVAEALTSTITFALQNNRQGCKRGCHYLAMQAA